ncbi:Intraflagellar transport protein 27 [Phlyctochytrium planicorne]|nr:Intraflagellar transport protein 27 [Phlyctochytrium planicorne]
MFGDGSQDSLQKGGGGDVRTVYRQKCLVLGNAGVGKSSLVQSFMSDGAHFPKNYNMTVHAELAVKMINIPDSSASVEMFIYDIGGHDVFAEYTAKYCEGASSFILVYDVSNPETFSSLSRFLQIAKRSRMGKYIHGVLIANKIDVPGTRRQVTMQQGQEFAKANKMAYFETSAANNVEVDAPFYFLSNWFHDHFESSRKAFLKVADSSTLGH